MRSESYEKFSKNANNLLAAVLLCTVFALFIGMRPHSGYYFGDTGTYAHLYRSIQNGLVSSTLEKEWMWLKMMELSSNILDASGYLTLVCVLYFGFSLWACTRLIPNNPLVAMLFVMGAFSFFTYGTNGIRNGLACAMVLTFLSYINGNMRDKIIAAVIAVFAMGIHKTTMLPIGMAVLSTFIIRKFKTAYTFWILSILISFVAGGAIATVFASMGFDDRLSYLTATAEDGTFSHTGFRFDFLIYSMMPIALGYYLVIKRGITDRTYLLLLNTYTLSNAFWVMVIRANYSNRFAYLSWFMYPLVLAYPLLKLDIWGNDQGQNLSRIMLAQVGFTWFMSTIY